MSQKKNIEFILKTSKGIITRVSQAIDYSDFVIHNSWNKIIQICESKFHEGKIEKIIEENILYACALDSQENSILTFLVCNYQYTIYMKHIANCMIENFQVKPFIGTIPPLLAAIHKSSIEWMFFYLQFYNDISITIPFIGTSCVIYTFLKGDPLCVTQLIPSLNIERKYHISDYSIDIPTLCAAYTTNGEVIRSLLCYVNSFNMSYLYASIDATNIKASRMIIKKWPLSVYNIVKLLEYMKEKKMQHTKIVYLLLKQQSICGFIPKKILQWIENIPKKNTKCIAYCIVIASYDIVSWESLCCCVMLVKKIGITSFNHLIHLSIKMKHKQSLQWLAQEYIMKQLPFDFKSRKYEKIYKSGHYDIITLLMSNIHTFRISPIDLMNSLHYGIHHHDSELVRILLSSNVFHKQNLAIALSNAAHNGNSQAGEMILERAPDLLNQFLIHNETSFFIALKNSNIDFAKMLIKRGATPALGMYEQEGVVRPALYALFQLKQVDQFVPFFKWLVHKKGPHYIIDNTKYVIPLLRMAIGKGCMMFNYLLSIGCDPNTCFDQTQESILQTSILDLKPCYTKLLLYYGAQRNTKNKNNYTALDTCFQMKQELESIGEEGYKMKHIQEIMELLLFFYYSHIPKPYFIDYSDTIIITND